MHWLEPIDNFRAALDMAKSAMTRDVTIQQLAYIANHKLDYLQVIQLDNFLQKVAGDSDANVIGQRLAVLSSATVNHIAPAIRVGSLRRGILTDVYLAEFDQYRQELFDTDSKLHQIRPQTVLFSLTARQLLASIALSSNHSDVSKEITQFVSDLRQLWERAKQGLGAAVIQQTFLNIGEPIFGSLDRSVSSTPSQVVRLVNDQIAKAALDDDVLLLDLEQSVEKLGMRHWFDPIKWHQAKIEIAPDAALLYGDLVARLLAAQLGLSRKCLVLDLDNTLWGGVIGDDGIENIVLGEGSALGEAYLAFQIYIKKLKERGIILAVCSKNEASVAESAFRDHPEMALSLSDFSVFLANWRDKATNIEEIATRLNIGLDSLVFFDDNPAERAIIRQAFPMVAVPEVPGDPAQYVSCLSDAGYFEAISFTSDDGLRNQQYAENLERQSLQAKMQSLDDYLVSLDMRLDAGPVSDVDMNRAEQLINKTNQFNMTTQRMAKGTLRSLVDNPSYYVLQFRLKDRFGDNGLVSVMIIRIDDEVPGAFYIENWVMSCRVFGRGLEYEALNFSVEFAEQQGGRQFTGTFIPTDKNKVIDGLYEKLGFKAQATDDSQHPDQSTWRLNFKNFSEHNTHIRRD